jgi:predicted phosphodiesterase
MRLHVVSDLHLEQATFEPDPVEADVVVLAGDIGGGIDGVKWARSWAGGRPVLYVAGNHEFYGHRLPELVHELRREASGSTVHVLEGDELVIAGVRFLGVTLWSDFDSDGVQRRRQTMAMCERVVNDYRQIRFGPEARALTAEDTRTLHLASRAWLAERLAVQHDGPTVVITHHAPLFGARLPAGPLRALAGAFASDVTALMGSDRVALWIFGHTHRSADLSVAGTRVFSNPRGYPHQPVAGFDPMRVIEVPPAPGAGVLSEGRQWRASASG